MATIKDILDQLNQPETSQKVASVSPARGGETAQARQNLEAVLGGILGSSEKTAAQTASRGSEDVAGHLLKVAEDLANADLAATTKEAQLFGAAAFDGFLLRANQYASATGAQQKQASAQYEDEAYLEKAASAGYQDMDYILGEIAQSGAKTAQYAAPDPNDFYAGLQSGLEKVAEVGTDCFERGADHISTILAEL